MNLWILTEEKPKKSVIVQLLNIYLEDFENSNNTILSIDEISPMLTGNTFQFKYEVNSVSISGIENIYIKTVSGKSSFVDFLVFKQENKTIENSRASNNLLFAVEETKTLDLESRNTGIYQRGTKFVYIKAFYDVPLYMLYNDEIPVDNSREPSDTNIFGTNMLLTLGVKVVRKDTDPWFNPFTSLEELIQFRDGMRKPSLSNVPNLKFTNMGIFY